MSMTDLQVRIERLAVDADRIVAKVERLKTQKPVPDDKIDKLGKQVQRLRALEKIARDRLYGTNEIRPDRLYGGNRSF